MTAEYESVSAAGVYFVGTITHIRDKSRFGGSAGGFVHGFRYTARALFKWLEYTNHGVPWPRECLATTTATTTATAAPTPTDQSGGVGDSSGSAGGGAQQQQQQQQQQQAREAQARLAS